MITPPFSFVLLECHWQDGFIALDQCGQPGWRALGTTDEPGRKLADGSIHFTANYGGHRPRRLTGFNWAM